MIKYIFYTLVIDALISFQARWLPIFGGSYYKSKPNIVIILMLCTVNTIYFYNEDAVILISKFDIQVNLDTERDHTVTAFTTNQDFIYAGEC